MSKWISTFKGRKQTQQDPKAVHAPDHPILSYSTGRTLQRCCHWLWAALEGLQAGARLSLAKAQMAAQVWRSTWDVILFWLLAWAGGMGQGRCELMVSLIWHKEGQKGEVVWWRLREGEGCRLGATQLDFGPCLHTWRWCTSTLALGVSCALCNINDNWTGFISSLRRVTLFPVNFTGWHAAASVCAHQEKLSFCCCSVRWWHPETQAVDPLSVGITSLLSSAKPCQQSGAHFGCMFLYPRCKIALIWQPCQIQPASLWTVDSSEALSVLLGGSFVFCACEQGVETPLSLIWKATVFSLADATFWLAIGELEKEWHVCW